MSSIAWTAIAQHIGLRAHDFTRGPLVLTVAQIRTATQRFVRAGETEPRILCKQDTREDRPDIFKELGLFLLPIKNGTYAIFQGEGYVDIPAITTASTPYTSKLDFHLETACIGDAEMQHVDFAYASSLIRTFCSDPSLVLSIRGRKYTPRFSMRVGAQPFEVESVQTEVDAGYEGRAQVVLIEAKNTRTSNVIIRQLYFPFRQWQSHTHKPVHTVFFERRGEDFLLWEFDFIEVEDYNSVRLVRSGKYHINAPTPTRATHAPSHSGLSR